MYETTLTRMIRKYPDKNWISYVNITEDLVREFHDKPWNWIEISIYCSLKLINDFPDKKWPIDYMSERYSITYEEFIIY